MMQPVNQTNAALMSQSLRRDCGVFVFVGGLLALFN
jgi:hypothetical protein